MKAGISLPIKARTGSQFRLSCLATASRIDVVYPQHVAREQEKTRNLHPKLLVLRWPGPQQLSRLPVSVLSKNEHNLVIRISPLFTLQKFVPFDDQRSRKLIRNKTRGEWHELRFRCIVETQKLSRVEMRRLRKLRLEVREYKG